MRGHDDFGTIVLPKESYATVRERGGCVGVALHFVEINIGN